VSLRAKREFLYKLIH